MKSKPGKLFDDSGAPTVSETVELTVNDDYAKRLLHNKKREDLHRLQERHKGAVSKSKPADHKAQAQEESDSSSEDEDEDDGHIPGAVEKQIFETLTKIRKRDRSIYDSSQHFFADANERTEEDTAQQKTKAKKAKKPMYLKDVIAQQALQHGAEVSSSDDEDEEPADTEPTYAQEQQQLKQQFLQAVDEEAEPGTEEDFGGGVLRKRSKASRQIKQDDAEAAALQQSLDEYFGSDQPLSEGDQFLKQYVLNKGWVDEDEEGLPSYQDIVGAHDDEDEEFDEKADQFESAYNFRFEEEGGRQMVTYPRVLEHTVRKTDERRKRKRAEKSERRAAQESAEQAEVKRLKNLKNQEIQGRLARIREISGQQGQQDAALHALLEGDFDPEDYDERMAAAFGDDYYGNEDEGPADILDDDLQQQLNEMADYNSDKEGQEKPSTSQADAEEDDAEAAEGSDADQDAKGAAAALELERSAVSKLLAEYDKLDYEDNIGGLKTRFRYRTVPKQDYGLTTEEILRLSDKDLNQVVGMKTMAPYREERANFRPNYGKMKELRVGQTKKENKYQQQKLLRQQRRAAKAEAGAQHTAADKGKQQPVQDAVNPNAQRMKAFQKLTLQHDRPQAPGSKKHKNKKAAAVASSTTSGDSGLSKAARKNMKRAAKRAAKQKPVRTQ